MMGHHKDLHMVAFILLIIGGLNWGLFALFHTDVGTWLGGMDTTVAKVIYVLVALAALYEVFSHGGRCKECRNEMPKHM